MKPIMPYDGATPDDPNVIMVAEHQDQYMTLPAYRCSDVEGTLRTRWEFDDKERQRIAEGGHLMLELLTFGNPLQPVRVYVEPDRAAIANAVMADMERSVGCGPECKCQGGDVDHFVEGDQSFGPAHSVDDDCDDPYHGGLKERLAVPHTHPLVITNARPLSQVIGVSMLVATAVLIVYRVVLALI